MDEQHLTKRQRRELKKQEKAASQQQTKQSKRTKIIVIWVAVIAAIGLAVWGLVIWGGNSTQNTNTASTKVESGDWVKGNPDANVVLIEYSDFQCPACGAYYPVVKQLSEAYGDTIAIVYRHYPLVNIHPNAMPAARAAEAAGKQDKFFAFHDILFEKQSEWSTAPNEVELFTNYAQSIGLSVEQFKTDMQSSEINDLVKEDIASGTALKVNATPSFFLQGVKIQNPRSLEDFKKLIDEAAQNAPIHSSDGSVHAHFGFKMYVNGKTVDLTQAKYQSTEEAELDPEIHVHDGNGDIVHIHAADVTIGQFLTSIGMKLDPLCLTLDDGKQYCTGNGNILRLMVNGAANDQFADYKPHDLDRILITYGSEADEKIQQQAKSVSDEACIYSEKCPERGSPPTENCVGGLGSEC